MTTTDRKILALVWTGPLLVALIFGGMITAGFFPPPAPTLTLAQTADEWSTHTISKLIGMVMCMWGGTFYVTFTMAIAHVLRKVESDRILSNTQAALGTFATVFFSVNFLFLAVAAFRPDRAPEVLQSLHDVGFIMTFWPVMPFCLQNIAIAAAVLLDPAETPLLPRWVAYVNVWVAVLFLGSSVIPLFKTGPFAWNGLLAFAIPVAAFGVWVAVMFWALRRAILKPLVEPPADKDPPHRDFT